MVFTVQYRCPTTHSLMCGHPIYTHEGNLISYWSLNYKPQSKRDCTLQTEKITPLQYHSNAPKQVYIKVLTTLARYICTTYSVNNLLYGLLSDNFGPYTYSYQIPGKVSVATTSTCLMRFLSQLRPTPHQGPPPALYQIWIVVVRQNRTSQRKQKNRGVSSLAGLVRVHGICPQTETKFYSVFFARHITDNFRSFVLQLSVFDLSGIC